MICEEVVKNTTLSLFLNPCMTFKKIKLIMVIAFNGEKILFFNSLITKLQTFNFFAETLFVFHIQYLSSAEIKGS